MSLKRRNSESQQPQGATRIAPENPRRRRSRSRRWMAVAGVCAALLLVLIQQIQKPEPKPEVVEEPAPQTPREPPAPRFDFYQELPAQRVSNALSAEQQAELERARALLTQKPLPPEAAQPVLAQPVEQPLVVPQPDPAAQPVAGDAAPVGADGRPFEGSLNNLLETLREPAPTQFVLQAGSWGSQQSAEAVRSQLVAKGMTASLETVKVGDKTWYRVLLGPYADKSQAEADSRTLKGAGFTPLLRRAVP